MVLFPVNFRLQGPLTSDGWHDTSHCIEYRVRRTTTTTFEREWERYWNLAMPWDCPHHVHTHRTSSTAFDGVRVDVVSLNATEIVRGGRSKNLALLDFSIAFSLTPSTVVDNARTSSIASVRTLMKSCNTLRPSPCLHVLNIVYGILWCATAVDRGWLWLTASVWTLLKSISVRPRILILHHPHVRMLPKVMDGVQMLSTTDSVRTRAVSVTCINLGLLTVKQARIIVTTCPEAWKRLWAPRFV